ncbi:isochorismate synthase [Shewanella youngdeokensis]|uniref:Isochorismate synthase MenF n=1 Tax=Shewanella youngdeokensis TaxID=2999068 RepID=A0ABZ0JZR8_9GAMM|nr:isochorismate synthase [Shewanella sp. DAU334]
MTAPLLSHAIKSLTDKLKSLSEQPANDPIIQVSVTIAAIPLIAWLAAQSTYPRLYWKGRDTEEEVAAIGCCTDFFFGDDVDDIELSEKYLKQRELTSNPNIRYYGGVAFDRKNESWPEFGKARFILPRIELRRSATEYKLIVNLNISEASLEQEIASTLAAISLLDNPKPLTPLKKVALMGRNDTPSRARWDQLIKQVTEPGFNEHTPKVVLSRQTQLEVSESVDPWTLLACWQGRNATSFQFGFQFSPEKAFISCTPERLYHRKQRSLFTEALAGTTIRGLNQEQDKAFAQALLDDKKNTHENLLVRQQIVDELNPLSNHVDADELPTIFKLSHIQHLHRSIQAELKAQVNDFQVIQALHPTPAVGGLPKKSAIDFIRQEEGYLRGWYAGACGYFNLHESEFAVAIRSALIEPNRINLFAGAGIVAGSEPDIEWTELENKLATILSILTEL